MAVVETPCPQALWSGPGPQSIRGRWRAPSASSRRPRGAREAAKSSYLRAVSGHATRCSRRASAVDHMDRSVAAAPLGESTHSPAGNGSAAPDDQSSSRPGGHRSGRTEPGLPEARRRSRLSRVTDPHRRSSSELTQVHHGFAHPLAVETLRSDVPGGGVIPRFGLSHSPTIGRFSGGVGLPLTPADRVGSFRYCADRTLRAGCRQAMNAGGGGRRRSFIG